MARDLLGCVPCLLLMVGALAAVEPVVPAPSPLLERPPAAAPLPPTTSSTVPDQRADDDRRIFLAALAQAPQVRALIERRHSARHLEDAAGRLPDPMLSLGYAHKRMSPEHWPMYDVALEQPLPRWGERDAARAMAASQTRLSDAQIAGEVALLAGDLAQALAEIDGARARLVEGEAEERRIDALARAIDARVVSGAAGVTERLGIETRRERLGLRLAEVRRSIADQEAGIRGRLGLADTVALPPLVVPTPESVDPARTPQMIEAEAHRQEALAALQAARAQRHPETAIGIRAEREAIDAGNEDTVGLTVSISLPLAGGALEANEEAAQARVRAADRQADAARWRTRVAVESAQRALSLAQRASQLAHGLLARSEAEQSAMTAALASGGGDLGAVLDVLDHLAELRLEVIASQVAARQAQAALWAQVIPELPSSPSASPGAQP